MVRLGRLRLLHRQKQSESLKGKWTLLRYISSKKGTFREMILTEKKERKREEKEELLLVCCCGFYPPRPPPLTLEKFSKLEGVTKMS